MEMSGQPYSRRLNDLEQRFVELAGEIPNSAEKEELSIVHGRSCEPGWSDRR